MRFLTIGGYGFSEESFLRTLKEANVDTFVDVRQRRGMRGAKYAFLNSLRLQTLLASSAIKYLHESELAPNTKIRDAQKQDDLETGTAKQDRTQLAPTFVQKYQSEILSKFDSAQLRGALEGADVIALFCVEGHPTACHRSLAAAHLIQIFNSDHPVEHLTA
jgi:uncharacterized protein (DUF488 family)